MNTINLAAGWATVWNPIKAALGPLSALLTAVGVLVVVAALVKWIWDKRRGGGGGGTSAIWWAVGVGVLFAAPDLVIPLLLGILDAIANAVVGIFKGNGAK